MQLLHLKFYFENTPSSLRNKMKSIFSILIDARASFHKVDYFALIDK